MNEIFFFLHIFIVIAFLFLFLRLGKASLITFISIVNICANIFVVKQISLFSFDVTASDVFSIGGIWGLNVLQEYFGKKIAKKAVNISLIALLFFAFMSRMNLFYLPNSFDYTNSSFKVIFSPSFRIILSSIFVFYLVQKIDIKLFEWIKKQFQKSPFIFRATASLLITQALDSILFSFLGLYGIVHSIWTVILFSYFIKAIVILTAALFNQLVRYIFRNKVFYEEIF